MLGAVSGMMVAPTVFLTPNMMQAVLIYAFAAAVLGGLESPVGAVVGGLALGVLLSMLGQYVGFVTSELRLPVALAVLLLVLLVRPAGLLGRVVVQPRMRRLTAPLGFAALVAAVVLAPFVFSHYRTFQLGFVAIYLVALLGLNMLTGFTGQISLGHGAFMGIGAYTTTILVVDHGWRDLWTIPVAGVVAGLCGLAFGLPATRFAGPYLALATFAIPLSFIGILKRFPHFTGGNVGKNLPQLHSQFGLDTNPSVWFYGVTWVIALIMLPLAFLIVGGRFGRALRAVRDSEIASTANGVSTAAMKTAAFGISAFYCGVAGALFAHRDHVRQPGHVPDRPVDPAAGRHRDRRRGIALRDAVRRDLRRVHPDQLGAVAARAGLAPAPHQHPGARVGSRRLRRRPPGRAVRRPRRSGRAPAPAPSLSGAGLV